MALTKVQICNMALSKIGNERNQLTNPTFSSNTGSIFTQCDLHYEQTLRELVRMHSWNCCKARTEIGSYKVLVTIPASVSQSGNEEKYTITASSTDSTNRPVYVNSTEGLIDYVKLEFNTTSETQWKITYKTDLTVEQVDSTGYSPAVTFASGIVVTRVKPTFGYDFSFKLPDNLLRCIFVSNTSDVYQYAKPNVEWQVEKDALVANNQRAFICYDKLPEPEDMDALFAEVFYTMLAAKLAVPVAGNDKLKQSLIEEFYSVILPEARRVNGFEQNNYAVNDSEWLEATYTTSSASNSYPPFAQTNYNSIP